jgi:putative Holliday junction resolvase
LDLNLITSLDKPETAVTSDAVRSDSAGRLLALDLGAKSVGVAVSDELRITANPLAAIARRSWKDLLSRVANMIQAYDARGLVIGLPLSLDGAEGSAAREARAAAAKFQLSLQIPVYLQDERLTTVTATAHLKEAGRSARDIKRQVDSESATVILGDFIAHAQSLNQE